MFDRVESLLGKLNVNVNEITSTSKDVKGVYTEQGDANFLSIIANSVKNFPKKSRIAIVSNSKEVKYRIGLFNKLAILNY